MFNAHLRVPGNNPAVLSHCARHATTARTIGLLRSFPLEQADPDTFYTHLAEDTRALIADLYRGATGAPLTDTTIVDVGGGPGYFERSFADAGAWYIGVEPDQRELSAAGITHHSMVRGSGMQLPIRDGAVDICMSSNVAEHVPEPWRLGEEMVRITAPGGLIVLSYTLWYGPFGGHEMGLTHYLGGARAARLYEKRHGVPPKNLYGESLFAVGCAEGLRWAHATDASGTATFLAAFPRYHPRWAWWATRIPVFREVAVSNLVLVLQKNGAR